MSRYIDAKWLSKLFPDSTISKMEQVEEQTDCTEALTLLWIKNMVTDEEFYRINARIKGE